MALAPSLFALAPCPFPLGTRALKVRGPEGQEIEVHGPKDQGAELQGAEIQMAEVQGAEGQGPLGNGAEGQGPGVQGTRGPGAGGGKGAEAWNASYINILICKPIPKPSLSVMHPKPVSHLR